MKIEARERLQSFQLIIPGMTPSVAHVKRLGDRYQENLEWVHGASNDKRLTVGFLNYHGKQLTFYVFYDDKCQGNVVFDFMEGRAISSHAGMKLPDAATPHSVLDPSIRGKGIVSFLYRRALDEGITLVTDTHTVMAAQLWTRIATSKFYLYNVDAGSVVKEPTSTSIKILTKKRLPNG